jgi:hypothetical protein
LGHQGFGVLEAWKDWFEDLGLHLRDSKDYDELKGSALPMLRELAEELDDLSGVNQEGDSPTMPLRKI